MKQSEISNLSLADLQDKLDDFKKQLGELTMAHTITPLENPLQIRTIRRTVARLQTAITQRQQEA
ncbi:MAG: 50S ribosomal protein L29 [Flavobacteriaceae bacterium]